MDVQPVQDRQQAADEEGNKRFYFPKGQTIREGGAQSHGAL
jgi:hypothetical protein